MAGFNLTAQLQLQAPKNTSKVVGDIRKQLSGITANIKVKADVRTLAQANKHMQSIGKSAATSSKAVGSLNRNLTEAARRFSVITVATGTMLSLARAIKNSVGEAIAFERELVKISQVTGKTVQNLQGLTQEVTKLSTAWGASSKELLNVSRVLAQAGFSAEKTRQALDILAKTSLGATFDSLADTTEGAIAVLRQFRNEAKAAGGDIKFLEQTMDAINSVSKSFAVESGDLITVIRRVGGVFESAGGSVNELIALFTSVRATTRESAETISTGLRTIFTRIQRTDTVDQLAALGIQLRDAQGQFVGAFEAVNRLSQGLSALDPRDFRFSEIVESLGGFRQIGKVIPLIRQFTVAQDALNVAQASSGSVTQDAVIAQQSLAVQAQKVRQEFDALVRKLTDSSAFRSVAQGALEMARAFIRIADALEPLLPLITGLIALKIGRSLAPGLGAISGIRGKAEGGRIHKFARGGFVPGTGNRDTVPAMLQPGEFVIKKSSASKLGSSTLEAMNNNRFRRGGRYSGRMAKRAQDERRGDVEFGGSTSLSKNKKLVGQLNKVTDKIDQIKTDNVYGGAFLRHSGSGSIDLKGQIEKTQLVNSLKANKTYMAMSSAKGGSQFKNLAEDLKRRATEPKDLEFMLKARSLKKGIGEKAESKLYDGVLKSVGKTGKFLQKETGAGPPSQTMDQILSNTNIDNVIGNLFEASLLEAGAPYNPKDRDAANAPFDFPGGLGGVHSAFVDGAAIKQATSDAKTSMTTGNIRSFIKKAKNQKLAEYTNKMDALLDGMPNIKAEFGTRGSKASERGTHIGVLEDRRRKKKAMGGKIDSVPALLTPGEYVINKSSAQSIGYGNLNKMNQTGVQRFAAGGAVQRFANGGSVGSGSGLVVPRFDYLAGKADTLAKQMDKVTQNFIKQGLEGEELTQAQEIAAKELKTGSGKMKAAFEKGVVSVRGASLLPAATPNKGIVRPTGMSQLASSSTKGAEHLKSMGAEAGLTTGSIKLFNNLLKKGMPAQKALEAATNKLAADQTKAIARRGGMSKAGLDYAKSLEGASQRLKKVGLAAGGAVAGKVGGHVKGQFKERVGMARAMMTKEGVGGAAQQMGKMGGAAQQIGFFGAAMATTAIQMSGLSDATKKAATEAIGFGTSIIGIGGSLTQMLTGLVSTGTAEAASNAAAKASEDAETASNAKAAAMNNRNSAAGSKMGTIFGIAAIAVVATISALKYFSAKQKATADEAAKSWKEGLKSITEGGKGNSEKIKKSLKEEIDARTLANKSSTMGMMAMAGSAAAAGAVIGSVIPVFGTVVGGIIGGLVGGVAGYLAATSSATASAQAEVAARQAEINAIYETVDSIISLNEANATLTNTLSDIDATEGLTTERQIELKLEAGAQGLAAGGATKNIGANAKLAELAERTGISAAVLKTKTGEDVEKLTDTKTGEAIGSVGRAAFETAMMEASSSAELVGSNLKASADVYKQAGSELTSAANFDELQAALPQFNAALKQRSDALAQSSALEIQKAQEALRVAEAGTNEDEVAKAREGVANATNRAAEQQRLLNEGYNQQINATKARIQSDLDAVAAAEALNRELRAMNSAFAGVRQIQDRQQGEERAIEGMTNVRTGADLDFSFDNIKGLDDITVIDDMNRFNSEVGALISEFPAGMQGEFNKLLANIQGVDHAMKAGRDRVTTEFASGLQQGELPTDDIIKAAIGEDAFAGLSDDMLNNLRKNLGDVSLGEGISVEEFDKIFEPYIKMGQEGAKKLQSELEPTRAREIANHKKFLNELEATRSEELDNQKKVLKVEQKSAAIMAKARGKALTSEQKDAQRGAAAQLALSGTGARAGDVRGVAQAKAQAQQQHAIIQQQIQQGNLDINQKKALMTEDKKLIDTIKKTDAELGRLADQSEKVGEIMDQIEGEKAKRETITNLLGDFVKGGLEDRQSITSALLGVRSSVATGTVQNQSAEQRSATFDMLDRLKDIVIAGTGGMTGKQVKQELIFRDAIRMGLDPAIAKQLATATTKEEELINSLDKLTAVINAAARARGAGAAAPFGAAYGGMVYRAGGGNIFKPKGTDTVPAMLTPGEFVVRKSAVDKIGTGTLSAINNGNYARGGVVYREGGGGIGVAGGVLEKGKKQIPTGDEFRHIFAESVRNIGTKNFFNIIKRSYGLEEDWWKQAKNPGKAAVIATEGKEAVRNIATLVKAGRFDPSKLTFPDPLAEYFELLAASPVLESINSREVQFKSWGPITNINTLRRSHTAGTLPKSIGVAQAYRNRLNDIMRDSEGGLRLDAVANIKEGIAAEVVKQGTGINVTDNIRSLRDSALNRWLRLGDWVTELKKIQNNDPGKKTWDQMIDHASKLGTGIGGVLRLGPRQKNPKNIQDAIDALVGHGILRMASGGGVPGTSDTVPAMLTPGEFVMSKSAVQQHGVGYMKSLNRGRIPGFNRGGVVGRGNVQYKHDGGGIGSGGGVLSLDPTRVQEVLTTFNTTFSASLDKIVAPMNGVAQSLSRVAEAFGSMTMTHEFSGNISMSVNIANKDAIIAAVSEGIQPNVSQLITNQVNAAVKEMKQNP